MTATGCERHPHAVVHRGLCAACLVEEALSPAPDPSPQLMARFTIQTPLGATERSSVFLAAGEWPWRRLLRLKTWRRSAPQDFVQRFEALQIALDQGHEEAIVMPLAAWIEADGHPCVLTEFRQGLPLLDCVVSKRLTRSDARGVLRTLLEQIRSAHKRGLVHGSIAPGNVLWRPDGSALLLDFGLAPLLATDEPAISWAHADIVGFASLERSLTQLNSAPTPRPSV